MIKFTLLYIGLFFSVFGFNQLSTFFVAPNDVDAQYDSNDDDHYVAINTSATPLNKLLIFIGGTHSNTGMSTYFSDLGADLGYHSISISYPNSTSVTSACLFSSDPDCHEHFRQELCYGTPVSSGVTVDTLNSIFTRTYKLLNYLDQMYPSQNWSQFISGNDLDWNKIVISGHSQGSGHALYFAKIQALDRTIMFSGANDYVNSNNAPAPWISSSFQTGLERIFSFLHIQDDAVDFYKQYEIIQSLGLLNSDDTTLVDNLSPPYSNSHALYSNETPNQMFITPHHNSTVLNNYTPRDGSNQLLFLPVWEYLLSSPAAVGLKEASQIHNVRIFPNPTQNNLYIQSEHIVDQVWIYDFKGRLILSDSKNILNLESMESGNYLLKVRFKNGQFWSSKIRVE